MHDQGDPEGAETAPLRDAEQELRELARLFDLAAVPQAETLVERARLLLRMAGDASLEGAHRHEEGGEGAETAPLQGTPITATGRGDVRGHR